VRGARTSFFYPPPHYHSASALVPTQGRTQRDSSAACRTVLDDDGARSLCWSPVSKSQIVVIPACIGYSRRLSPQQSARMQGRKIENGARQAAHLPRRPQLIPSDHLGSSDSRCDVPDMATGGAPACLASKTPKDPRR
jgi:hypothetical protein